MSKKINQVIKDKKGDIKKVKFEGNSSFTNYERAINMAEKGQIENTHVYHINNKKYLRSDPDNSKKNNLDNL